MAGHQDRGARPASVDARRRRLVVARLTSLPRVAVVGVLRGYQKVVSPWTPQSCRYYPSCSQYALVAVRRHGVVRGGWLAVRRLARCHPWAPGGVDDVPPAPIRAVSELPLGDGDRVVRSSTR